LSYSVDPKILLYASDESSRHHEVAAAFLAERPNDPEIFCLTWPTLMAYVRIATHPRIFSYPLAPQEALCNVAALMGLPRVRVMSEEEGFLEVYHDVCGEHAARGNQVPDAHLAALLRQHGVSTLYTADTDFRKFPFLDVRNPFQG